MPIWCGRLKIPWVCKSVGLDFLLLISCIISPPRYNWNTITMAENKHPINTPWHSHCTTMPLHTSLHMYNALSYKGTICIILQMLSENLPFFNSSKISPIFHMKKSTLTNLKCCHVNVASVAACLISSWSRCYWVLKIPLLLAPRPHCHQRQLLLQWRMWSQCGRSYRWSIRIREGACGRILTVVWRPSEVWTHLLATGWQTALSNLALKHTGMVYCYIVWQVALSNLVLKHTGMMYGYCVWQISAVKPDAKTHRYGIWLYCLTDSAVKHGAKAFRYGIRL